VWHLQHAAKGKCPSATTNLGSAEVELRRSCGLGSGLRARKSPGLNQGLLRAQRHNVTRMATSRPQQLRRHWQSLPAQPVPYSITSSALASNVGGMARPSTLAVLRLIASSNLVGCATGKVAGLAPFKILAT